MVANREFLAPWDPLRDEQYFTADAQGAVIGAALDLREAGTGVLHVILDESGTVVGRIMLSGIVRGALESCAMGYWVSAAHNGRGLATAAVREMLRVAFNELGLHRVQAETLLHNAASRRVLERNRFSCFGVAPKYLQIAGRWQDHAMHQVLSDLT